MSILSRSSGWRDPGRLFGRWLSLLDRYTLRQLLLALVATTGGLAALMWLTQSLRFVSLVVDRGLSLRVFVQLTSLMIPSFLCVILPITTFIVSLFVYQRLSEDRELTVMRASGLSPLRLARAGLLCAVIATIAGYALNIWIAPSSYHSFRKFEFQIRNKMAAFLLQEGVFTQMSDQMTVYVRTRDHDGTLHGIVVEDDRQSNSRATIIAEHGALVIIDDQPRVVLYNGSREEIDRKTGRLNVLTFDRNTLDLSSGQKSQTRFRDAAEMSIPELFHPDATQVADRDRGKLAVEAYRRLTSPLTAFSFAMIGIFTVLRGTFSRHGSFTRPLLAILVVVGMLALNLIVQNLASRNLHLVPLIWIFALLPGLACSAILFWPELRERVTPWGAQSDARPGQAG